MYAGKTTALIARLAEARERGEQCVTAFRHTADSRYNSAGLATHDGGSWPAISVPDASAIVDVRAKVVGIDEAQFFGHELIPVAHRLVEIGAVVVIAGLDIDAWNRPFPPIPELTAAARRVMRLRARCAVCGELADFTQRVAPLSPRDVEVGRARLVGGSEKWEPRCAGHFVPLGDEDD
jgi:thymidine kinase